MKERSNLASRPRRGRLAAPAVLATLAVLVSTAALAWLVAPAFSTEPYAPEAVDFTMPIENVTQLKGKGGEAQTYSAGPHAGHSHGADARRHARGAAIEHGPIRFRTPPLKAPGRFDLVGVGGGKGPFEYRVREDGGNWTDWVETDPGAPVYTGGTDFVQVRSRQSPIQGELHFVNVSGDRSLTDGIVNGLRTAVNSAVLSAVSTANASVRKPKFISRRQWGANGRGGCKPRTRPEYGKVKAGVVHHTVSTNSYSEAEAPGMVLAICRFHRNGNGWNDIGYNALVDRFGNIYQGRAGGMRRAVVGAQAEGVNAQTAGVSALGDYGKVRPSKQTVRGIVNYLTWRLGIENIRANGRTRLVSSGGASQRTPRGKRMRVPRIFEHGLTNYTACAGSYLNQQIPKIRKKVNRKIRKGGREKPEEPPVEEQPEGETLPQAR